MVVLLFAQEVVTVVIEPPSRYVGLTYQGPVDLDGQPHGRGKMSGIAALTQEEYLIDCNFVHGQCDGFSIFKNKSTGKSYVGQIKKDERNGHYYEQGYGKSVDPRQGTYEGEWKEGRWDGFGTYTDTRGNVFIGEFVMNTPHGMCKAILIDGTVYFGEWVHGQKHGVGSLTFPNGDRYIGEFYEDSPAGVGGSIAKENGARIFGEFEQGKITGIAVEKNPGKGFVRVGEYQEDMIQGLIAEKTQDGELILHGSLNGKEKTGVIYEVKPDGERYLGEVSQGKPHGEGMLLGPTRINKIGRFQDGIFQEKK
ncbi:MAG: hypothetical protein H3C47_08210 [Candidatus Cloacimonetes bacterium]|nr:hypothetical protein [Candidatus Cloacimonadota bacterium]